MATIEERYISLLTDFGFKRIFGTAPNKELLINFLRVMGTGTLVHSLGSMNLSPMIQGQENLSLETMSKIVNCLKLSIL